MKVDTHVLIVALTTCLLTQQAGAASIQDMLEEAFDTQTGNVTEPVDGQMADWMRRAVPIKGDVTADVKTVKVFKQKDCRRFSIQLKAEFDKDSGHEGPVPTPIIEMNYCKGGGYPQEGVDPEAGKKFMDDFNKYVRPHIQSTQGPPQQGAGESTPNPGRQGGSTAMTTQKQ